MGIREELGEALKAAMKRRDMASVRTFRNALSLLDNATAVPMLPHHRAGAVEASRLGVAAGEESRRELTEVEMLSMLRQEVAELRIQARELDRLTSGAGSRAAAEADLLENTLGAPPSTTE